MDNETSPADAASSSSSSSSNDDNNETSNNNNNKSSNDDCQEAAYCSLCWKEDGDDDFGRLYECRDCGVRYHYPCYRGVCIKNDSDDDDDDIGDEDSSSSDSDSNSNSDEDNNPKVNKNNTTKSTPKPKQRPPLPDTCIACASIGKSIKGRTKAGKTIELKVESRPYECCLCSVDNPNLPLAMHPIYDRNNGRQLVIHEDPHKHNRVDVPLYRLAWCHTLCARMIDYHAPTGGCVYQCDSRGNYAGYEGDEDDRSIGSGVDEARQNVRTLSASDLAHLDAAHHYVIVLERHWLKWFNAIKKAKRFKCSICLKDDTKDHVFRIPITCMCREKQEPKKYQQLHPREDDQCNVAMHVGCAMWGRMQNGVQQYPKIRRVFYSPFLVDDKLFYCSRHAKDLRQEGGMEGAHWMRFPGYKPAIEGDTTIRDDVQLFQFDSENDSIQSDDDDDRDSCDDDDDDDDDDSLEGDDNDAAEPRPQKPKRHRTKKSKKSKNKSSLSSKQKRKNGKTRRGPYKAETGKDRLERTLARKEKGLPSAVGGGGNGASCIAGMVALASRPDFKAKVNATKPQEAARESHVEDDDKVEEAKETIPKKISMMKSNFRANDMMRGKKNLFKAAEENKKDSSSKEPLKKQPATSSSAISKSLPVAGQTSKSMTKQSSINGSGVRSTNQSAYNYKAAHTGSSSASGSKQSQGDNQDEEERKAKKARIPEIAQQELPFSAEERLKRQELHAHILREIAIKHGLGLQALLHNVLDEVEAKWKDELPRCGLSDSATFLKSIREDSKIGQNNLSIGVEDMAKGKELHRHILREIALKRDFRLQEESLEKVLNEVESIWKDKLAGCGISDADSVSFFRSIREDARIFESGLVNGDSEEADAKNDQQHQLAPEMDEDEDDDLWS